MSADSATADSQNPSRSSGRVGHTGLSGTANAGLAMRLTSVDTLNWSHPTMQYRVRLHPVPLPEGLTGLEMARARVERRRSLGGLLGSKTKGKRFHGYLEGDYEMGSSGFYTNNLVGLRRLFAKYPEVFESVQTLEQYRSARALSELLTIAGD